MNSQTSEHTELSDARTLLQWSIHQYRMRFWSTVRHLLMLPFLLVTAALVLIVSASIWHLSHRPFTYVGTVIVILYWMVFILVHIVQISPRRENILSDLKTAKDHFFPVATALVIQWIRHILAIPYFLTGKLTAYLAYTFTPFICLTESVSFRESVKRSVKLVKGREWWIIERELLFAPLGVAMMLLSLNHGHRFLLDLVLLLMTPLEFFYIYKIYKNLQDTERTISYSRARKYSLAGIVMSLWVFQGWVHMRIIYELMSIIHH